MTLIGLDKLFSSHQKDIQRCLDQLSVQQAAALVDDLKTAWESGHGVYLAGNEGCALTAIHFASDLSNNTRLQGAKGLLAIPLVGNVATLTGLGAKDGYDQVFVQQLQNCLRTGDLFIAVCCTGDSPSLVSAVRYAREIDARTFALTGAAEGEWAATADQTLQVASDNQGVVETVHLLVAHLVCEYLKQFGAGLQAGKISGTAGSLYGEAFL